MTLELEELKSEQASKVDVLQGLIEASESDLEQAREKAEMDKLELNNKIGQMNQEIEELQAQVKDWKQISLEKTENLQRLEKDLEHEKNKPQVPSEDIDNENEKTEKLSKELESEKEKNELI